MAVKNKNSAAKKAVKKVTKAPKTAKKIVKPKKTIKKVAAKTVKKAIKKPVAKSVKNPQKIVKKAKPVKKAESKVVAKKVTKSVKAPKAAKKMVAKKAVLAPAKPIKATPKLVVVKTSAPQKGANEKKAALVASIKQQLVAPRKPEQPIAKKQTMREQSKMTSKVGRNIVEEIDFIENVDLKPSKKATTLLGALEFTPYQVKESEAYMNEHQRDHFRKILDAWKQQLMQDVDTTVGHLKEEAVFYADPVDRASQEEGFNLELRTRDRERRLIKKIEQSLDLINTGEYGFCEDCGADIGVRRLEARPTAVKCIDCKTFQEIREKQMGG